MTKEVQAAQNAQNSHLTFEERYRNGKELRAATPREELGNFTAPPRDAEQIFDETNKTRLPSLIPIRRQRMSESAFAFLRGSAALMATDLSAAPMAGVHVQACGDSHLMNFGAFLSPEDNALFDINDFDETLPGVDFTVDLRRLAASCAIAALDAGDNDKTARRVAKTAAKAYRERMSELATLSPIDAWRARIDLREDAAHLFDSALAKRLRGAAGQKYPHADDASADFPHLTRDKKGGELRIEDHPPLIYHAKEASDPSVYVDINRVFEQVAETLAPEVRGLVSRYHLADAAFKVVGVGSVGTYCAIGLFTTKDDEPLFLQLKEALPSALERLDDPKGAQHPSVNPWHGQQGRRVVSGQRIMQAASDLFLGYMKDHESGREFYVRRLKNRLLGSIAELLESKALPQYASLCGRTLARAHARSGDAATIFGYMGKTEAFDDAIASFAMLYAAQNKKDYEAFVAASPAQNAAAKEKPPASGAK